MTKKILSLFFAVSLYGYSAARPAHRAVHPQVSQELQEIFSNVVDIIEPALVNISNIQADEDAPFYFFFRGPLEDLLNREPIPNGDKQESTASGFVISTDGYILTNYHVIRGADELAVALHNGETYDAEIVGTDPYTDLAVIKINPPEDLEILEMGDSDEIQVGNWVVAAGSPFGLNNTYTTGIISGTRQNIQVEDMSYQDLLQTDAAINRGNSGGPLVNLMGEAIGVNTAIFAPTGVFTGIGFAIPINQAKAILEEMIQTGQVSRGWLGIEILDVDPETKAAYTVDTESGAVISGILGNSPAEEAGLQIGDVVVEIDGMTITTAAELQEAVADNKPGTEVSMLVIRNSEELRLSARLGERVNQ